MTKAKIPRSVHGLLDVHRLADLLDVPVGQVRTWHNRQKVGAGPLAKIFPPPIARDDTGAPGAQLGGSPLWTVETAEAFAAELRDYKPRGGRKPARLEAET